LILLHVVLIKDNKRVDIEYNMNYMKVFEYSKEDSSSYMNEKCFFFPQKVWIVNSCTMWKEIWKEFQILFKESITMVLKTNII
jgi:hypothetical protein